MKKLSLTILIILFSCFLSKALVKNTKVYPITKALTKPVNLALPTVTTTTASAVSSTFATLGGNVTSSGGLPITERGIVYDTDLNPTTSSTNKIVLGTGTGSFSHVETGLAPNRFYVFRAYAINSEGTTYGENQTFTTKSPTEVTSITRNDAMTSNAGTVHYTVDLSQPVTGITAANFIVSATDFVTQPVISNISGSGSIYTVTLNTGTGSGSFQLAFTNSTGINPAIANLPVYGGSYVINRELPQVTITGMATAQAAAIPVTIKFSKSVNGFAASDIVAVNASVNNFTGSGDTYTLLLTPAASGTPSITIPAGSVVDALNNQNAEKSASFNVFATVITSPALAVSSVFATLGGTVNNDGGLPVTERGIVYDTDYNPTIASTNKIVMGSGTGNFSQVEVGLAPNRFYVFRAYATTSIGTSYGENQTFTTRNLTEATSITRNDAMTSNAATVSYTVKLSQPVTGITAANFTVPATGLTTPPVISNISGSGDNYIVTLSTGTGSGSFQLAFSNSAGIEPAIANLPVYGGSYVIDRELPVATIAGNITAQGNAIPVTVSFSKNVTGFTASDIVVTNGSINTFTGSGSYYTFILTPAASGIVQITIPANIATDASGNGNAEKTSVFNTLPAVNTTMASAISSTFATLGGIVTNDGGLPITERGIVYDTDYNPTTSSTNKIVLGSGTGSFSQLENGLAPNRFYVFRAYATNSLGTSYGENQTFTTKIPTEVTSITRNDPMNTEASTLSYTVNLSQPVTGISAANFTVPATGFTTPPAITNISGSGDTYVVTLSAGTGTGSFQLAFSNTAGISPAIANLPVYGGTYNVNPEKLTATFRGTATTQSEPFLVNVGFSRYVNGFSASDLILVNATLSGFNGDQNYYGFVLTPIASGPIKITLPAGAVYDNSGNLNVEASFDYRYLSVIRTDPATSITSTAAVLNGTVVYNGGLNFIESGLVYSTEPDPTITSGIKLITPSTNNVLYSTARDLTLNTTYYFKAYAINDLGISYGEQLSFTTAPKTQVASITRIDAAVSGASTVNYSVKLSQPVRGLDRRNFTILTTGFNLKPVIDARFVGLTGFGSDYVVSIRTGTGSGTLQLQLSNSDFVDPVIGTFPVNGEIYTINRPDKPASMVTTSPGDRYFPFMNGDNFIDTGVVVSGDRNANIAGAKIVISNFDFGDMIQTDIVRDYPISYSRTTGVLTIFSQVTVAECEMILRSLRYVTFSSSQLTRTLSYTVNDGATDSPISTKEIIRSDNAVLSTAKPTSIGDTFATMGGEVTNQGGPTITVTERGVVYGNNFFPDLTTGTKVIIGSGPGSFSQVITGLTPNTFYAYRPYAINKKGISYGPNESFTTLPAAMPALLVKNGTSYSSPANAVDETGAAKVIVHQALSPNGDGLNDVLYIEGIKEYPKNQLLIMSSSGRKVFETQNYDNVSKAFSGRSSTTGSIQPAGTYYYLLKYTDTQKQEKRLTGYFILKNN